MVLGFFLGRSLLQQRAEVEVSGPDEMAANVEQRIRGFHRVNIRDGEKFWDLRAEEARVIQGEGRIIVEKPELELYDSAGTKVSVRGKEGRVLLEDGDLRRVDLAGEVVVSFGDYYVETPEAVYFGRKKVVLLPQGVTISSEAIDLTGDLMTINMEKRLVGVAGHVVTTFRSPRVAGADGEGSHAEN